MIYSMLRNSDLFRYLSPNLRRIYSIHTHVSWSLAQTLHRVCLLVISTCKTASPSLDQLIGSTLASVPTVFMPIVVSTCIPTLTRMTFPPVIVSSGLVSSRVVSWIMLRVSIPTLMERTARKIRPAGRVTAVSDPT